ncbi:MAG TPA: metalloregulator ArsR/SmtB family transcription factor [Casimicrobiaceae bacterium]|nr:metalloregulator ArsR/SmtB family transcription factor [Casimicrobiaceae bacterium]
MSSITTSRRASRNPAKPLREADELDLVFDSVARYFSLLAEPMRLKILHTICRDERSVSDIVKATGATQTNVSRHLALMHRAGVVSRRRDGTAVLYKVLDPEMTEICRSMCVRVASRIEAGEPLKRDLLDYAAAR